MVLENRVVYRIPEMDEVQVQRNVRYHAVNDTDLKMDLFYPPNMEPGSRLPAVIFVFGFPRARLKLKDSNAYVTWAQLTAASGLIAVLYETEQPETDINELFGYIRENAASLKIDEDRIGIWSCSSNVPTALSLLMKDSGNVPKCAVLYYGLMLVGRRPPHWPICRKNMGLSLRIKEEATMIYGRTPPFSSSGQGSTGYQISTWYWNVSSRKSSQETYHWSSTTMPTDSMPSISWTTTMSLGRS